MPQNRPLSQREWEVARLLQEGKSNKPIASLLQISERTVEFHLKNIFDKFQVHSRVELVLKLGESTVAHKGEAVENRDGQVSSNWSQKLRGAVSKIGKELLMENAVNTTPRGEGYSMPFFESIRMCLTRYAEFNGRATRPEFWWFALAVTLVASALVYVHQTLGNVFLIAMLLPFLAAGARRLHDIGKSAWWLFFLLVPVGGIVLLGFWWAMPSTNPPPDDTPPGE